MNTRQALNSIEEQVLPRAVELEKAILGAIMVEPDALARVSSILNPDCFYEPVNREIYNEITRLYSVEQARRFTHGSGGHDRERGVEP